MHSSFIFLELVSPAEFHFLSHMIISILETLILSFIETQIIELLVTDNLYRKDSGNSIYKRSFYIF